MRVHLPSQHLGLRQENGELQASIDCVVRSEVKTKSKYKGRTNQTNKQKQELRSDPMSKGAWQ